MARNEGTIASQKRATLMQALEFEPVLLDLLMQIVNAFGYDLGPFSDENLGSSKWKLGAGVRAKTPVWKDLTKTTSLSRRLVVEYANTSWFAKPEALRRRLSKQAMEELLHIGAMAVNLIPAVQAIYPIDEKVFEEKLQEPFAAGNMKSH